MATAEQHQELNRVSNEDPELYRRLLEKVNAFMTQNLFDKIQEQGYDDPHYVDNHPWAFEPGHVIPTPVPSDVYVQAIYAVYNRPDISNTALMIRFLHEFCGP